MKNKKLILNIVAVLGITAFSSINAHATTWYVRDGGGTSTQCTGTTNAVYPGSGTNQPCAFNHPAWVTGGGNFTGPGGSDNGPDSAHKWAGGDTMYIDGDSDITSGAQAQYMIGAAMPNASSACSTVSTDSIGCGLLYIPAGISASQPTSIIGTGTHQPQLWGTQALGGATNGTLGVLTAVNGNILLSNLEITDHDSCTAMGVAGSGSDGFPAYCGNTSGAAPFGPWAEFGIIMEGTNLTTNNLWVHRFADNDIFFPGNLSNWNSTNDKFTASGQAIDDGPAMTFSGTNTLTNDIFAFGGCMEHYPEPDPTNVRDPANYVNCADQNNGGLGGGFMMQNDGNASCGNWVVNGTQFLFNLKTNWDFLHCDGTGTVNMYRSRSEGSSGETIKLNVAGANLEESEFIGNAPIWTTPAFTAIDSKLPIICRGGNVMVFAGVTGAKINLLNDTVTGNCVTLLGTSVGSDSQTCAGMSINASNTLFLGGYAYDGGDNNNVSLYYASGGDGNGSGSCGTGAIAINQSHNAVFNTFDNGEGTCSGTDVCSDPQIVGESSSTIAKLLGPTSYYTGQALSDLMYLQSSSPLKGAGATGLTYTNGSSNDYNNFPANNPPDIGAIQYTSCIAASAFCSISGECCGGTCNANGQCGAGGTTPKPVVSITSPTSGSSFTTGNNVTVTTTASETNGTITNIALYNGSTLLGQSSVSPYSYVMTNAAAGTYNLTAVATDANSVSTTSNLITVTVQDASILPSSPVAAITSPSSGSSFTAGSNVTITTTASETNGTISLISLYSGTGILLGTSSTSPYNFVDTNMAAGTYTFYVVAIDLLGLSVTSSAITVTVTTPSVAASITTQPVSKTVTAPATATFSVAATGTPALSYQWEQEAPGATLFIPISGANSASYTTSATTTANSGAKYECLVSNASGSAISSVATLTVTASSTPPVVTIMSPTNGSSITAGSNVTIIATASEKNGTIGQVQFYKGTTLMGTDAKSPYSYTWTNVPTGSYTLTAKAIDTKGVSTMSSALTVTVTTRLRSRLFR